MAQVLTARKIGFKPTPKTVKSGNEIRFVIPHIILLVIFTIATVFGVMEYWRGSTDHTLGLLVVNIFWLFWNGLALVKIVRLGFWNPVQAIQDKQLTKSEGIA